MRGFRCGNCDDAGCDYCKPSKAFDPHKIERPYVWAWGHSAVYVQDYDALLKLYVEALQTIEELRGGK